MLIMEFSLNERKIEQIWQVTEAWNGVNLKILSLICVCLAGAVVASWSLTQGLTGLKPFTVMTNFSVTEFSEFNENL